MHPRMQSSTSIHLVGTALSFGSGCVGEGEFTVEEDRQKLVPVMQTIVKSKLMLSSPIPSLSTLSLSI